MVKVQRLFAKTNLKVPICRTYRTITQKCLQLELPTENSVYSQENRNRAGNYAHLTSENGKLAAFASGRPAFQQHTKRTEGSDTSHVSHTRKALSTECENCNFDRNEKRSRSPAGPRRLRDSDAHKHIAVPQALCVLQECLRPRPKSGKVCRSTPWPRRVSETCETVRG